MRSDATSQGGWRVWDGRRTIASCVYTISPSETGTTSNGSIAVAIAAPCTLAEGTGLARATEIAVFIHQTVTVIVETVAGFFRFIATTAACIEQPFVR